MTIELFLILVAGAGIVAVFRIYTNLRKLRKDEYEDWDSRIIAQLRAQGSDPFRPYDVSFFFAVPSESTGLSLQQRLQAEGFAVDLKPVPESSEHPFSLHASKALRLSVPDMREYSKRFSALAKELGGRYDGWTAGSIAPDAKG